MTDSSQFKKLKLVEEQELMRLIAKQLRDYDPALHSLASMKMEMDSTLERSDLSPEEKLALLKGTQQRFSQIKGSATAAEAGPPPPVSSPLLPALPAAIAPPPARSLTPPLRPAAPSEELFASPIQAGPLESTRASAPGKIPVGLIPEVQANHAGQLNALSELIAASPEILSVHPESGEIIIAGTRTPNSSFHDLVKSLYEQDSNINLTGQEEFLFTVGKILGKVGSEVKIRNFVPRTSLHASIKKGLPSLVGPRALPHSTDLLPAGQEGKGKAHPPGKRIKALYLYS